MSTPTFLHHMSQKDVPPPPPRPTRWDNSREAFEHAKLQRLLWERKAYKAAFEAMLQTLPDIRDSLKHATF